MTLNLEAIRLAQANNEAVLADVKQSWISQYQYIHEQTGVHVGYRPGPVPDMAWLGVGDLSSSSLSDDRLPPFITENAAKLVNNGAHFPAFRQLDRPASLKGKCRIVTCSQVIDQEWIQRIWDNENLVFYVFQEEDGDQCIKCSITTADNDEPLALYVGYSKASGRYGSLQLHYKISNELETLDGQTLLFRIMHNFLRIYAYMLPAHNLREVVGVLESISPLTSKKYKADYLDWQILRTDFLLNLPSLEFDEEDKVVETEIHNRLMDVGTALAALERFEEAAAICAEVGNTFPTAPIAYYLAAQSFQLLGNEETALEFHAKHLGRAVRNDPNPDLNNPAYENVLVGMLMAFFAKFEKSLQGREGAVRNRVLRFSHEDIEALGCVALFSTAHHKMEPLADLFGVRPGTNLSSYLKNEFRRKAKKVLVKLMRLGSIMEYKKVFRTCMLPDKPLPVSSRFDTSSSDEFRQHQAKAARKGAQELIKKGYTSMCFSCGEIPPKVMCCPCKKVHYCSKKCQLVHWQFHKSECSHHQKKAK